MAGFLSCDCLGGHPGLTLLVAKTQGPGLGGAGRTGFSLPDLAEAKAPDSVQAVLNVSLPPPTQPAPHTQMSCCPTPARRHVPPFSHTLPSLSLGVPQPGEPRFGWLEVDGPGEALGGGH